MRYKVTQKRDMSDLEWRPSILGYAYGNTPQEAIESIRENLFTALIYRLTEAPEEKEPTSTIFKIRKTVEEIPPWCTCMTCRKNNMSKLRTQPKAQKRLDTEAIIHQRT